MSAAPTSSSRRKRLGPADFGYTFVGYEPPPEGAGCAVEREAVEGKEGEVAAGGSSGGGGGSRSASAPAAMAAGAEATVTKEEEDALLAAEGGEQRKEREEEERFVYEPKKRAYHDDYLDNGDHQASSAGAALSNAGTLCCCLFVPLVAAGGILLAVERYSGKEGKENENELLLAATITFVLAACSCICGCVSLCVGCAVATIGGVGGIVGGDGHSNDDPKEVKLRLRRLNDRLECGGGPAAEDDLGAIRRDVVSEIAEVRKAERGEARKKREEQKERDKELEDRVKQDLEAGMSVKDIRRKYRPVAFYVRFDGDIFLSDGMELLRKQVSLIVGQGKPGADQAVVVVTSPGGSVSDYGLAASQLVRIRKAGIRLVVCVDTVAASGGFMMASVADHICAAPFALVGSIGVVTQIPNFQRWLNKHDVDAYLVTAGQFKRTIDIIGDVTEEGKAKLQEELDDVHAAFKDHIGLARPRLGGSAVDDVATGEAWLAVQAKEKGLVDEILTSDEYLESLRKEYDIIEVRKKERIHLLDHLQGVDLAGGVRRAVEEIKKAAGSGLAAAHWSSQGSTATTRFPPMAIS